MPFFWNCQSSSMSCEGARQNFHQETEAGINKQINLELFSSYFYLGLAYHFDRDDIALPGFHKYFKGLADEERQDAEKVNSRITVHAFRTERQIGFTSRISSVNFSSLDHQFVASVRRDVSVTIFRTLLIGRMYQQTKRKYYSNLVHTGVRTRD